LNFASLTLPPQEDYLLGTNDVLEITIYDLYPEQQGRPAEGPITLRAQVMSDGQIHLPLVGAVRVGGMNVSQAQRSIIEAYADGFIKEPQVSVYLLQKGTTNVLVLGEVTQPGVYQLPNGENDVAHALAMAQGLRKDAAAEIEVHRRIPTGPSEALPPGVAQVPTFLESPRAAHCPALLCGAATAKEPAAEVPTAQPTDYHAPAPDVLGPEPGFHMPRLAPPPELQDPFLEESRSTGVPMEILRIPFRGTPDRPYGPADVVLSAGDVVVVPSRRAEVFYVVGKLSPTNFVRFSLGIEDRDLGAGFVLPRDREVDVVTAVAMAGYIDPIDSPTTVTVHRRLPDGQPLLIRVDLIKARYDYRETVLVQAGDIIYLNPDLPWWLRRTFDRVVPELIIEAYRRALQ
jgi:hypothetical protein